MHLDFGKVDLRSAAQIASSLAASQLQVLQSEASWQSGAIWLHGESESGHEVLAKSWAIGANTVIFGAEFSDEQDLLAKLVEAESGQIRLLLVANIASNKCEVASADLASRLRNLTNLQMPPLSKALMRQIMAIAIKEAGISQSAIDIEAVISKTNLEYVTISKLICFIIDTVSNSSKLSKSELSSKIDEFIDIQRNHDLFDDK